MNSDELAKLIVDPAAFQDAVVIKAASGRRRFGEIMAPFQRERFDQVNPALQSLSRAEQPSTGRYWWEATKGCSKDTDLAVCLLWLLSSAAKRPLTCQVGAVDKDQAAELRKAARDVLSLNAWLAELVEIDNWQIVSKRRPERVVEIIAADAAGSHGARPDLLVINELTHHKSPDFAETLMDNAAKVQGVVVIATNAGHVKTWQEEWRDLALGSDRWRVHIYSRPAPWISEAELAEARRRNSPNRYARLWQGKWVPQVGEGIPTELIDAAIRAKLKPLKRAKRGWVYVAGVDLARAADSSAVVVLGKQVGGLYTVERRPVKRIESHLDRALRETGLGDRRDDEPEEVTRRVRSTGRLRLADVRIWRSQKRSKQKHSQVEKHIRRLHARFGLAACAYDPHDATLLAERLIEHAGVPMIEMPFTTSNLVAMASATVEDFRDGNIELFECDEDSRQLVADLRRMQIVEMGYGSRLSAKRTRAGHCDAGTACVIAELASRDHTDPEGDLEMPDVDLVY